MMKSMAVFEWKFFVKQPSFYVTSLIFFLLPFLSVTIENVQIGATSNLLFNSPFVIYQALLIFSVFGMFLAVNFVGNTATREYSSNMQEILYTKPLRLFSYHLGRFIGSYATVITVFAMVPIGLFLGSLMPWVDAERLGPKNPWFYIQPFLVFSIPTFFTVCAIFYAAAVKFRNIVSVYLVALFLFVTYILVEIVFDQQSQRIWLSLLDPFGLRTFEDLTRYWTMAERNTTLLSFSSELLWNRLLWLGIGIAFFVSAISITTRKKAAHRVEGATNVNFMPERIGYRDITAQYQRDADGIQFWASLWLELKQVFATPSFFILIAFCAFQLLIIITFPNDTLYGARNYPLTQTMVETIQNAFGLVLIIIVTFYTAEIVWRERTTKVAEIIDSYPVANSTFWTSKLLAVSMVVATIHVVGMIATILYQLGSGFFDIDLRQYFISLFFFDVLPLVYLIVLSFFIQVCSPNKFFGMFVFVAYFVVSLVISEIGLEHNMFNYSSAPSLQFSDMNDYGWYITTQSYYMLYWGGLAVVFAALSSALWQRGGYESLLARLSRLHITLGNTGRFILISGLIVFLAVGTTIHHNTTVTNEFTTKSTSNEQAIRYETQYSEFENMPLPTITDVIINTAMFPTARKIEVIADFTLENKTNQSIRKVLINLPKHSFDIRFVVPGAKVSLDDAKLNTAWVEFENEFQAGDTLDIKISLTRQHFSFKDKDEDFSTVENGIFINNYDLLPTLGVMRGRYLNDPHDRRLAGLPPLTRAFPLESDDYRRQNLFGLNGGKINFTAHLSTTEEQIAIAPGKLVKYWTENGRNQFVYQTQTPMVNFYNLMSADLAVSSERYKDVDIQVYYHSSHEWNVPTMLKAARDSLDYFEAEFGPYPNKVLRIVEFPGYRRLAQSYATTVSYSERMGFTTDTSDLDAFDPVYYITAHEVAHQWFGHQLIPANVQGAGVISESLSQYAALQVMQQHYGQAKIRQFLNAELDAYLAGRTRESIEEMPLLRSENQDYIHYNKGAIIMMGIASRIGVDNTNNALREMITSFSRKEGSYPTTLDLLNALKSNSDQRHHVYIESQFNDISIYDLRLLNAQVLTQDIIDVEVRAAHFKADGVGNEFEVPFTETVEIALYSEAPEDAKDIDVLYRQRVELKSGINSFQIPNMANAKFVVVDPDIHFIDRESRDNYARIKN